MKFNQNYQNILYKYLFLFFRSAFFWFAADERPKVRAANPSFAVGDIAKELGKRWAEFGPTFKQKYEAKAEKDRERYVNAKQDFQQMLKDEKNGMDLSCLLIVFISSVTKVSPVRQFFRNLALKSV